MMPRHLIRPVVIKGDYAEVSLTRGYIAIIDADCVDLVAHRNWTALVGARLVYARRNDWVDKKIKTQYLHRVLTDAPDDLYVDHINGDTLDNRKSNMRICEPWQNSCNRAGNVDSQTGVKGVTYRADIGRFLVQITACGVSHKVGWFNDIEGAGDAYALAAANLHGEFARTAWAA